MTPAAPAAAAAAVGLLLQVVERVHHVLQTVHVVPTKTVVILYVFPSIAGFSQSLDYLLI